MGSFGWPHFGEWSSRVADWLARCRFFFGGNRKNDLAAPAISFTDIAGREVQLDKLPKTFVVANYIAKFFDGRRSGESG
mgnify:CR=1 FL=1